MRSTLLARAALGFLLVPSALLSQELQGPWPAASVERTVLAISGTVSKDRDTGVTDIAHELLEMPLQHLGMVVRHVDLKEVEAPKIDWSDVRGVVTCFRPGEDGQAWLWPLLEEAAGRGKRVVHVQSFGPLAEEPVRLQRWLERVGLQWWPERYDNPAGIRVVSSKTRNTEFEARPIQRLVHQGLRSFDDSNEVWLETIKTGIVEERSAAIVSGHWGAVALEPWFFRLGGAADDRRWFVDPFEFFRESLGLKGVPVPDPCVVNGRRAFMLHVDGDGFESVSTVRKGVINGKVFLDDVVDAFELPMTISVIIASLTDDIAVEEDTANMKLARTILMREHVEAASHTVLHPLHWRRRKTRLTPKRTVTWFDRLKNYEHDMVAEVRDSIRFINDRLLRDAKRCRVLLWSGRANPRPESIRAATELDCVNLNGGTYRWDDSNDSVGFVRPWSKRVGNELQVYCGAANENVFAGFFSTMPNAFWHIDETLERTGRGRILKPANIYVHFYSSERPVRHRMLLRLIQKWGIDAETAPIHASDWSRAVAATQNACRIQRIVDGFALRDFGGCRSLRIDGDTQPIDWNRSPGVAGARRLGASLYVHLSRPNAELRFRQGAPPRPHLHEANHIVRDVSRTPTSVRLTSSAFSRRILVFGGFAPNAELQMRIGSLASDISSDVNGRVRVELPRGTSVVEVLVP